MNGNDWSWLSRWCRGRGAAKRPASRRPAARSRRPWLEELECRRLLSATNLFGPAIPLALNINQPQAGVISQTPSYYAFSVTDAGRLTAEVAATGGATRLTLLSADGSVLMQSDGQSAGNPNDLIDLHLTGSTAGTTYYLEVQALGGALGTFDLQTTFATATPPFQTLQVGNVSWGHAFDLNADGIPDMVVANFKSSNVSVLLGLGDGTFAPQTSYDVGGSPNDVCAVDLRGNGVSDLVVANLDGSLEILRGRGDGTFDPATRIAMGTSPSGVVAGDFDGDGRMDLAMTDFGAGNVAVLFGKGDGTFAAPSFYAVGSGPYDLVAGDFNKDGHRDLAVTNYNSNSVSLLVGNADGTFRPQVNFAVGHAPYGLAVGDFNGDGRLDIATANYGSNDVSVLLGTADGFFAPATTLGAGPNPYGIVAVDLNNDGQLDLAVTNFTTGTLSVLTGRGDGTFGPPATINVGSTPSFIVAADFNGDGRMDLAHGDYAGHVFVEPGRGDGTFLTQPPTAPGAGIAGIVSADFNGDGILDLATVNFGTGDLQVLLGQKDGTFQSAGRYALSVGSDPMSIATGDFNHDGIPDLVVTNYSTNSVSVLLGRGDGTFGTPTSFATGGIPRAVVVGDFNGDGIPDLAVADSGGNTVSILLGDGLGFGLTNGLGHGDGTFAAPLDLAVGKGPSALVAGDFNGDGILDLATANVDDGSVSVLFGRGDGTFGTMVQMAAGAVPSAIVAGDFNGDGILDLATANTGSGTISVFLGLASRSGKPSGAFASQTTFAAGSGPSALVAADLNRDGRLDLAVTDSNTGSLTVLLGRGDGTFQAGGQVAVGANPLGIVAGDFNGDGLPDLATGNSISSDVSVLLSRGDGTFRDAMQTAVSSGPVAIARADFDNDGNLDLVTADPTSGNVQVSLANGDGTFQTPVTVAQGGGPVAVTTGDFNRDGRQDIAVANSETGTVSILLGIGDGTFSPPLVLSVGSRPDALTTGDFNGDGLLDLAVADYGSGTVSVFLGRADGSFAAAQRIAVGAGPVALAVGDVNADGTFELIVGNSLSRSLSFLEGAGDGTFRLVSTVALGVVPTSVVTGDFNGDGRVDVAVASQAGNTVSVLLGNGDGTFRAAVPFATGAGPVSLVTGDFNGDGRLDLATANTDSNDVTVLLGRGDGTFQAQTPFGVGTYPLALVAGDFNNDGRLDLATANGLGVPVSVGLGLGNGTFLAPGASFPPIQSPPLVADFNGDGILDVVVLRGDGKILFRAGQGGGLFLPPVVINPDLTQAARDITYSTALGRIIIAATNTRDGSLSFYTCVGGRFIRLAKSQTAGIVPAHIVVGDMNGDGLQDVVLNYAETGRIVVYLQRPNEDFSRAAVPDYQMHVEGGVSDIILADMNGDGRPDVIATDQSSGEIHIFLNSAVDPFSTELSFRAGTDLVGLSEVGGVPQVRSGGTPLAVVAGFFSGGTIPDLAVLESGANRVDILAGDGHGGVFNPSLGMSLHTGLDPVALVTADFNGDGIPDLAVLNKGSNDISIFLGNGHGGFTEQTLPGPDGRQIRLGAGNAPTGSTVADIDGDGKLDLLVGDAQGDVLTLLGNGDGSFRPYQRIDRHVGLAVTDQGTDGKPGFAFADQSLDQVTYQSAQSTTAFQQGRQNGVVAPSSLQFADLNGDGIPDLIVTNSGGNDILVYLGQGNDRFGPAHRFFAGTNPVGVTVGDLNGNGIPDLVAANKGSNDLSVWFGQGRGANWTMTPGPRLEAGVGPVATVIQDVNGDGAADILVANSGSNDVYLLAGVGRGFFDDQHPVIYRTGSEPVQLFVGRFGDGPGLDLVTVDAGSNDLTFFAGFGPGRSVSLGGLDPVAAIAGDFNGDGTSDLIVAHKGGAIALLLGGLGGPQVTNLLDVPGLTNVSDLAFGQVTQTGVDFYATVDGRAEAIPLAFVFETAPEAIAGPTSAQVVNRQVTEFTSAAGSAELEVIATLTLGFDDSTTISTLQTNPGGRILPALWETVNTDRVEAAVDEEVIARGDGAEGVERNASIAGAAETPLQEFLNDSKQSAIRVPFSSPLEVFDGSGSTPPDPDEDELVSAAGRSDSVVGASVTRPVAVEAERIHPPAAGSPDRPSSPPTLRAPGGRPAAGDAAPAADELEDRAGSWLLGLRRLASLAISLLGGSFVRERPAPRSETPRHQRSNR